MATATARSHHISAVEPTDNVARRAARQHGGASSISDAHGSAQVAQLVEQRTENPCVGGSIPPLGTAIS